MAVGRLQGDAGVGHHVGDRRVVVQQRVLARVAGHQLGVIAHHEGAEGVLQVGLAIALDARGRPRSTGDCGPRG